MLCVCGFMIIPGVNNVSTSYLADDPAKINQHTRSRNATCMYTSCIILKLNQL
jgi:hypothetical protein